ncbi:MAG: hypothetical protein HRT52_13230 [Colwellia sp.]|nr:hypothetical protein [Colwellia sp.]
MNAFFKIKQQVNLVKLTLTFSLYLISNSTLAQTQSCFKHVNIEPSFIGFTEPKNSNLGDWYKKTFGLTTVKEFTFPDGSVTGVLMNKDEFIVEVFYRDDAVKVTDIEALKEHHITGVMKFGIFTNANLDKLKQCLVKSAIKATRIWKDKNLHVDMLQVTDPSNNVIEIISRQKN